MAVLSIEAWKATARNGKYDAPCAGRPAQMKCRKEQTSRTHWADHPDHGDGFADYYHPGKPDGQFRDRGPTPEISIVNSRS
jgi:hypothetical protein